jgi:hypothetical protein
MVPLTRDDRVWPHCWIRRRVLVIDVDAENEGGTVGVGEAGGYRAAPERCSCGVHPGPRLTRRGFGARQRAHDSAK